MEDIKTVNKEFRQMKQGKTNQIWWRVAAGPPENEIAPSQQLDQEKMNLKERPQKTKWWQEK